MKKIALALICVLVTLALASCATVNSDNSFQNETAAVTAEPTAVQQSETQPQATDAPQPTDTPTPEPGYNG